MKISVVINTYNAAGHLEKALLSVKDFDEIVVCDMESTDLTVAIAQRYGAKIVTFPKGDNNICEVARDYAIHSASHPWVLVVDADEIVPVSLRSFLYDYIKQPNVADALSIPFRSIFMGRFSSIHTERHIRFFKKDKAVWPPIIHAPVRIDGTIKRLPAVNELSIEHFNDPTLSKRIMKINRYTDNEVPKRKNKRYSALSVLWRPWFFFFKTLLLKGAFKDGRRGIFRAYMECIHQILLLGKHFEATAVISSSTSD